MSIRTLSLAATAPAAISDGFLSSAVLRRQRAWLIDQHLLGVDPIAGFTGFASLAGFTDVTVNSADEMRTAMQGGDATTKKRILCAWNGVSNLTTNSTITGFAVAGDPPLPDGCMYRVEPASGFGPSIGPNAFFLDFAWLDFRNMGFSGQTEIVRDLGSENGYRTAVSFRDCAFASGLLTGDASTGAVTTTHVQDCVFDGVGIRLLSKSRYTRAWRNIFTGKDKNGDLATAVLGTSAQHTGWTVNFWWAGNMVYDCDNITTSANHFDALQYGLGGEPFAGMNILYEFNITDADIPASQGFFTDGGGSAVRKILIHNNLTNTRAGKNAVVSDSSGDGFLSVHRNTFGPAATNVTSDGGSGYIELMQVVAGIDLGRAEITRNLHSTFVLGSGYDGRQIVRDNQLYTLTPGDGNYWNNLVSGQVTAGSGDFSRYSRIGIGQDAATARSAFSSFFMPIGGYNSSEYGMRDPSNWPTDFTAEVI